MLTYLKLRQFKLGLLINWNVRLIMDGIKCILNGWPEIANHEEAKTTKIGE